jgi:uncharacterized protein (TIGR02453 family)
LRAGLARGSRQAVGVELITLPREIMTATGYFSPQMFDFLRRLKRNNRREWFNRNKHLYQQEIVEPALRFISDFSPELARLSPHFLADPRPSRGSLFRIYRDTRFSLDKRPYKTHVGIHFHHASGKDAHAPVYYLHLEPGGCFAAAGIWHPDNVTLTRVRSAIVKEPERWAVIRKKLELEGGSLTRPPRGFDPNHRFIDDLKMKDFISSASFSETEICGKKFMREFTKACRSMSPLVEFTTKALGFKY